MAFSSLVEIRPLQELVENGVTQVPKAYIFFSEKFYEVIEEGHIPVIDLSGLLSDRQKVVNQIGSACKEWGCFQVVNHGINHSIRMAMLSAARHFYNVPVKDKMRYFTTIHDNRPFRYSTSFNVARDSVLEWKDVLRLPTSPLPEAMKSWPPEYHLPRDCTMEYFKEIGRLISKLLEGISESLGPESDYLNKTLSNPVLVSAINFYPPCPNPDTTIGVKAHTDPSAVTMLLQDEVAGLQVFNKDRWHSVKPIANALVVNIGDQVQILSNGRYQSGEHRVVPDKYELRISVATFCSPALNAYIEPAPKLVDRTHPSLYKRCLYKDFLADYTKRGPNVRSSIDNVACAYYNNAFL